MTQQAVTPHSPEPWIEDDNRAPYEGVVTIYAADGFAVTFIGDMEQIEGVDLQNAKRIIACVNGCKDMTNEQLAALPVATLLTERTSVLAALKSTIIWVEDVQTMLRRRDVVDASDSAHMALQQLNPLVAQLEAGKVKPHPERMIEVQHDTLTMIQDAITEALGWMRDQHQDRDVDDKSFSEYLAEALKVVEAVLTQAEGEVQP